MKIRGHLSTAHWPIAAVSFAAMLGVGCSQGSPTSQDQSASATYQELGAELQNCVVSASTCLKTANCDATQDQACRDEFKACHDQNKAAFQAFGDAVKMCVDDKHQCRSANGTAGTSAGSAGAGNVGSGAQDSCRQQFHSCIDDSRPIAPPPGPCTMALRTCVQDSMQASSGAAGGSGSAGRSGGRWMPNPAIQMCFETARTCFMNELPPRCGPPPGSGMGGQGRGVGGRTGGGTGGA